MAILQIDNKDKIGKEELLLGNVEVNTTDCNGNAITLTGLTGNDLVFKLADGNILTLAKYIESFASSTMDLTNTTIQTENGKVVKMVDIVNGLQDVEFTVIDLQAQYNTLKG